MVHFIVDISWRYTVQIGRSFQQERWGAGSLSLSPREVIVRSVLGLVLC